MQPQHSLAECKTGNCPLFIYIMLSAILTGLQSLVSELRKGVVFPQVDFRQDLSTLGFSIAWLFFHQS